MIININKKKLLLVSLLAAMVIVALALGLYFGLRDNDDASGEVRGAIVTNGLECAAIGAQVLEEKGSVADAAIAALFCEGIACPQSMGLGGGFLMTIYIRDTQTAETLNARESAPIDATEDMYAGNPQASAKGGLAVAVPGELKGYWELHKKYGKLEWARLVQPTIDLCRKGHTVSPYLHRILVGQEALIKATPSMSEIYINPSTGKVWEEGDKIKRLKLADTLEAIQKEGVNAIYGRNGTILPKLVKDIQDFGGIIKEEDFLQYEVKWGGAEQTVLKNNETLHTIPLPGTGNVLNFMLNILKDYVFDYTPLTFHRIVESFKFGYAKRTFLGDKDYVPGLDEMLKNLTSMDYARSIAAQINDNLTYLDFQHYGAYFSQPEDHGTAHINILAPNGDAIAATSTINYIFGAFRRSQSTGIILNDEMDDFATPNTTNSYGIPASPANFIKPGKRPLSSMTPTIITDSEGDVKLVIGSAGGSRITTAVAYVTMRHLYMNETLETAVNAKRVHHQLAPMRTEYEIGMDAAVVEGLRDRGHVMYELPGDGGFAALTAISYDKHSHAVEAIYDPRRGGSTETFKT